MRYALHLYSIPPVPLNLVHYLIYGAKCKDRNWVGKNTAPKTLKLNIEKPKLKPGTYSGILNVLLAIS